MRVVGLVRGEDDAEAALACQLAQEVEHFVLVGKVERRGRFVQEDNRAFARYRAGNEDELALSAGKLGEDGVCQMGNAQRFQGKHGTAAVLCAWHGEGADVRGAPHQHDVLHAVGKGRLEVLRHEAAADVLLQLARQRAAQAEKHIQQGAFAAAVRAEDGEDFAAVQVEIKVVKEPVAAGVAVAEVVGADKRFIHGG